MVILSSVASASIARGSASALGQAHRAHLPAESQRTARRASLLLFIAQTLAERRQLDPSPLAKSRLFGLIASGESLPPALREAALLFASEGLETRETDSALLSAHRLGQALDLLRASEAGLERRRLGSYYTPPEVARTLLGRACESPFLKAKLRQEALSILDPACGGGAFLLEALDLCVRAGAASSQAAQGIYGTDLSPLAVFVSEISLWLYLDDPGIAVARPAQFLVGDALTAPASQSVPAPQSASSIRLCEGPEGICYEERFPEIFERGGFDWIVGNPPWVAFQGRATQPISKERRAFYRQTYRAFRGFSTLHGLFVERALQLAPRGAVSFLLPSSVSDLDGYESTRRVVRETHVPLEPLLEFGQDAFEGVVQPCFGLLLDPGAPLTESSRSEAKGAPFRLEERTHRANASLVQKPPPVLAELLSRPSLPKEVFREMGFQSNRVVVGELFLRGEEAQAPFLVPLLEGKNVSEFQERRPRLFLHPDPEKLAATNCRLRDEKDYGAVSFVVRQTAAFTIAARHQGERFRNSLLAGFETQELDADLLVGLLNSALFRALHVSRRRDARQSVFPQVKIGHLRSLPAPPKAMQKRQAVRVLSQQATAEQGLSESLRHRLDVAVFDLFGLTQDDQSAVIAYLTEAVPGARRGTL